MISVGVFERTFRIYWGEHFCSLEGPRQARQRVRIYRSVDDAGGNFVLERTLLSDFRRGGFRPLHFTFLDALFTCRMLYNVNGIACRTIFLPRKYIRDLQLATCLFFSYWNNKTITFCRDTG